MNRDDSNEKKGDASEAREDRKSAQVDDQAKAEAKPDDGKRVANIAAIPVPKRVAITKIAKRFERYGHVRDGQQLVELIKPVAKVVKGEPVEVPASSLRA